MRLTEERCPLCGARGQVDAAAAVGYYRARCGDCYEGDPEAPGWRQLQGFAQDEEHAIARWLDNAREYAVDESPPPLTISYMPTVTLYALAAQIALETERQRGWVSYKRAGRPVLYGPAAGLSLVGEVT